MDRVTESNVILIEAWDEMSRGEKAFESRRGGLVDVSWSGQPVMFLNMAVTMRPPLSGAAFREAVQEISAWAAERQLPWMFAVCRETLGELMGEAEAILEAEGFAPVMPMTGMEATALTPEVRPKAEGVWLTEASEGVGVKVLRVNEEAYQIPLGEPGSLASEQPGWWGAPSRMVSMLEVEGDPASCAAVLSLEGMRYVALVATKPGYQKKGYAAMAMRDALERSLAAGLKERTYLHATAAGRPVYAQMGYEETAEYTVYMKKEFLPAEH